MASFAIVPAAGRSRRMGKPKLLLPWEQGDTRPGTLIEAALAAWRNSRVTAVVVVVDARDAELIDVIRPWLARPESAKGVAATDELDARALKTLGVSPPARVNLVTADPPPPEMKDSILWGLNFVADRLQPSADDVWLLAPADMPTISPRVIDQLLAAADTHRDELLSPTHAGRRGHPVLFPWPLAAEVARLGDHEGVNQLLKRHAVIEIDCGPDCLPGDIDTAEDYARERFGGAPARQIDEQRRPRDPSAGDAGVDQEQRFA